MNRTLEDRIQDTVPEQVTILDVARLRRAGRRRRHLKRLGAAGGSALVALGVLGSVTNFPTRAPAVEPLGPPVSESTAAPPASPAMGWPAELLEAAEATPRLLLSQSGWEVTLAMFAPVGDEMRSERVIDYSNGDQEAELQWTPGDVTDELVADLTGEGLVAEETSILGHAAALLTMPIPGASPSPGVANDGAASGGQAHAVVFFDGEYTIEFVSVGITRDQFVELVDSLERVDADMWLSALPDSQIPVTDPDAFITDILDDLPGPPDFEADGIAATPLEYPYSLRAKVVGQVSCGWISQWVQAEADGDLAASREAVDAMAAVAQSDAIDELNEQGAFGGSVTQYADAIAGDGTVTMGSVLTVEETYQDALGCS